jgi:hypothetical protein
MTNNSILEESGTEDLENMPGQRPRKKMIHTEQISSSMQLKLLLSQRGHSYSKRNIALRYSSPSPHLSSRVYDPSKENIRKDRESEVLPPLEQRRSFKAKVGNMKKTGSYWKDLKKSIRQMNKEMLY